MAINYIALAIPAFFLLIGIEIVVAWRMRLSVYRFNDAVTDLSCGIGQQVVGVFMKGALVAGYAYCFSHFTLVTFPEGSWVPWAIAFVGVDFAYYWWHRLSHEVAFMWAVHVVHHQSEDYNLAVALRQAWFSMATSWLFYLPLAFFGVPTLVFVTIASFSTLYQFWIHTRTVGKLGPIEWVFNTASHHRVHHGRDPKYLDKNYGATLIVWDRLFGSFQEEEEEPRYGVIAPYSTWNPVWANFDFWAHLVTKARATPRLADRLRVFVKGPGWLPPGVAPHEPVDVASEPPVRFVTATPRALVAYVLVQFVPVVAATVVLMFQRDVLSPLAAGLAVLVVVTSLVWGGLFERKAWALPLEIVRLAAIVVVASAAFWSSAIGGLVFIGLAAAVAASVVWVIAMRPSVAPAREGAVAA